MPTQTQKRDDAGELVDLLCRSWYGLSNNRTSDRHYHALLVIEANAWTCVGEMQPKLNIKHAAEMSRIVATLYRKGWIERRLSDDDYRKIELRITDAGRDALTAQRIKRAAAVRQLMSRIGDVERACLLNALRMLSNQF